MSQQESTVYRLFMPETIKAPILISVPHCGTLLTETFTKNAASDYILSTPDTDWFVHELYDFANEIGLPLIHANYSRYIIDLNRQMPGESSLYNDLSRVTELTPLRSFSGEPIYKPGCEPDDAEMQLRIQNYYQPYYDKVSDILDQLKAQFSVAMLYDGHSIKGHVTSIQQQPFVDYMPANRSGLTCPNSFIKTAENVITNHGYSVASNGIFQGGNITRSFAAPDNDIYSFQMEISQRIYMNEETNQKETERWTQTQQVLRTILSQFSDMLVNKTY